MSDFDFRTLISPLPAQPAVIGDVERFSPRLIPGGPNAPELCMLPADWDDEVCLGDGPLPFPGFVEVKSDGYRALYIDGQIYSREGTPLQCAAHCLAELVAMERAAGEPIVFDAEYVAGDFDQTTSAFRSGRAIGQMFLFDAVPMRAWSAGLPVMIPYEVRRQRLVQLRHSFEQRFVGLLASVPVTRMSEVNDFLNSAYAQQQEGLVYKRAGSPYVRGRSGDWRRIKKVETMDLPVSEVLMKNGVVAGLIVAGGSTGGAIRIGSGLNAVNREQIMMLRARDSAIIVEVAFNRKAYTGKIRHARLMRVRLDKSEAANG